MSTGALLRKRARFLVFEKTFRRAYQEQREWRYQLASSFLFEDPRSAAALAAQTPAVGFLDGEFRGDIHGWAVNTQQPGVPPKVLIYINGKPAADVLPVWFRFDVGPHGFFVDACAFAKPGAKLRVEARFANGEPLPQGPVEMEVREVETPRHPQAVLFLHIPRTAGTAFREAVTCNYQRSHLAQIYPDEPGFLPCELGFLPLEQRARFRLVLGHFSYGLHEFLPQESTYVTIVRDPVERVVSHFLFAFLDPNAKVHRTEHAQLLVKTMEQRDSILLDNVIVRICGGVPDSVRPGHVGQDAYERALDNLRTRFSFVGYQHRAGEAYDTLKKRFGWTAHASLDRTNAAIEWTMKDFEPARSAIEHFNRWDCKLYSEIQKLFP